MPRVSVADCEALLRMIEASPAQSPRDSRVVTRLRQRIEQASQSPPASTPSGQSIAHPMVRPAVLHVCTSCRPSGAPREPRENRAGFKLYQTLRGLFRESPLDEHVEVRPAKCLSVCPRPCGIAFSSPGAWSYLFGDQDADETARAILECASLYIGSADGFMPRAQRPKQMRAGILGRVPPDEVER